jgi:hypothetical protein
VIAFTDLYLDWHSQTSPALSFLNLEVIILPAPTYTYLSLACLNSPFLFSEVTTLADLYLLGSLRPVSSCVVLEVIDFPWLNYPLLRLPYLDSEADHQ